MKRLILGLLSICYLNLHSADADIIQKMQNEYQNILKQADYREFNAIIVNDNFNKTLYELIKDIAIKMNISVPNNITIFKGNAKSAKFVEIFGGDLRSNAFANGSTQSSISVCIGENLLNILTLEELKAIIAHELAHVKLMHPRKKLMRMGLGSLGINAISAGVNYYLQKNNVGLAKRIGVTFLCVMPASIINIYYLMKHSRQCEYEADSEAMKVIKDKNDLISAIGKIEKIQTEASKKCKFHSINKLFDKFSFFGTHPSLKDRNLNLSKNN